MYYNIKIKAKGSELGLESNDRLIIEKEMDLYFSRMFDVSEEFKAGVDKFKDVKIVSNKVKSINDIELLSANKNNQPQTETNPQQQAQPQQPQIKTQVQNSSSYIQQNTNNQQSQQQTFTTPKVNPQQQSNNYYIQNQQQLHEPIKTYEEFSQELDNNIQNHYNQQNNHVDINEVLGVIFNKNEQNQNEIKQQIIRNNQQAQNQNNQPYQQNNNIPQSNSFSQVQKQLDFEQQQKLRNQHFNRAGENNIFETAQQQMMQEQAQRQSRFEEIQQHFIEQQAKDINNSSLQINLQNENEIKLKPDIALDLEDVRINPQTGIAENIAPFAQVQTQPQVQRQAQQQQNLQNQNMEQQIQSQTQQPIDKKINNMSTKASEISFSAFLMGFSATLIHDQFLVAAFYIKNILKQSSFSLKFLNSTLFQATGKIADLSVVEELIQIGYINSVDLIEILEYTITPLGEDYLISKLKV